MQEASEPKEADPEQASKAAGNTISGGEGSGAAVREELRDIPLPLLPLLVRTAATMGVCLAPWALLPAGTAMAAAGASAVASVVVAYYVM